MLIGSREREPKLTRPVFLRHFSVEVEMPAKSKAQQRAAGAALSAKRGETLKEDLFGASKEMFQSMTEAELEELAHTKTAKLPQHKISP
jgi:Protein of unknwon function (DUF3008)